MIDYSIHTEKRSIQDKVFPLIKKNHIITLAGPNVKDYLSKLPEMESIEIWENDGKVMLKQLLEIRDLDIKKVKYNFGDIYRADVDEDCFYDLDFCCTIKSAAEHVKKFKDCAFMITLSLRDCILPKTIDRFLKAVGEEVISDIPHPQFNLLTTDKNEYIYTTYCDSSPMVTIFKFH